MIGHACGNCGGSVDQADSHLAECLETIGELYCSECWEEMLEANAAYEREDHDPDDVASAEIYKYGGNAL